MAKETISQTEGLCKEATTNIRNAYDKGYKQGYADGEKASKAVFTSGILKGREEAWEYARKIAEREDDMRNCFHDIAPAEIFGKYSVSEAIAKIKEYEEKQKAVTIQQEKDCDHCSKVYGTLGCCTTVSNKWVYFCEEGHKQYAERHKADGEIKVGDEILIHNIQDAETYKAVVMDIDMDKGLWIFDENACNTVIEPKRYIGEEADIEVRKTGRTFPQIAEVLEQLKGE